MKKTLVLAGSMLALMASIASAQGINLAWDDCNAFGTASKSFDCGSNSGLPFPLIASFLPPTGVNEFLSIESQLDITSGPNLPEWWKHGTGTCRTTSGLSLSFDFTSGPFNCVDPWVQPSGGFSYDIGFGAPNRARMRILGALPFESRHAVTPGTEYYAFKVNVQRAKSAGSGSCPGCSEPMCIVLNNVKLVQPEGASGGDRDLTTPAPRNFVTWQAPTVAGCPLSTPTHNSSWGRVKSLYR